jgi:hypothetical protein
MTGQKEKDGQLEEQERDRKLDRQGIMCRTGKVRQISLKMPNFTMSEFSRGLS